jgi:amino acid transporter
MSAAFAAPSTSIFFNSPFVAANAGLAMPAAFLASAIAIGFVAVNIAAFSRKLPTSGYAYTFVSHGLGPRAGFVAAWMTLLVFIGSPVILAPYFGITVSALIQNLTGVHIPWAVLSLLLLALVGTLAVLGISDSLKVGGVFVLIELTVVTVFSVYMLARNPGHQAPAALSPRSAPSIGGFAVAMIFGILSFQGFEAAATLGEETTAARVRVPRALLSAIVVLGVFYTVSSYGAVVGWGSGHLGSYATSASPFVTLGQRYAGSWLADIFGAVVGAGLLAGTIASSNASARMLFAMGRERVLPAALGKTSERTGTPVFATLVVVIGGGLAGIVAGVIWSPVQVWGYMGSIISLGAIIVYHGQCGRRAVLPALAPQRVLRRQARGGAGHRHRRAADAAGREARPAVAAAAVPVRPGAVPDRRMAPARRRDRGLPAAQAPRGPAGRRADRGGRRCAR